MLECYPGSGHLVCRGCVNNYVSEQLDGNNSVVFNCIVDTNCKHRYSSKLLDQELEPKLKQRKDDREFRDMMKKASLGENQW